MMVVRLSGHPLVRDSLSDATRHPTVAYEWDVVKLYTGLNKTSYKTYTNELDALTHTQVYELAQHLSL